ncbi:Transcriptional regulator containing PAS AAA-type ATPase and DNA-binding domains-like protein [Thioalkalivibrio sulfidiphilus HL-EbGr7]|uniref:Transcriptional regulator containing PAS AAA-type ATPase and DNA-binding domains-like protein n=1 Tax=Thioalkalivibrio sulfidiphilus (strain HL-EbGR7) TaxID=396588 RepID=B8GSB7_THISH|nr:sigma 54-interacting transcriptional regulator [Thioalkalivibrio sulfidiphilus]ACL72821.1 Transcriptional regulator containing PAS AAA-type ATPase and DNA-binding domains-like protein [Thioalkalivibrio sulfidiphilus HL-EbGr7]
MDIRSLLPMMEAVVAFIDEGVVIAERSGEVIYQNPASFELLGIEGGVPLDHLKNIPGISFNKEMLRAAIEAGEVDAAGRPSGNFLSFEILRERNGGFTSLRFHSGLVDLPSAKTTLRLVLISDITERRRKEVSGSIQDGGMVTNDSRMRDVVTRIQQVAPTTASLLILGESGTGKTRLARMVHALSERAREPFVEVNCAAIPESLIESELFGHVKGAFTGALHDRAGRFQSAHKGTLFLDEVTEIPLNIQAKLLRALQDQEFEMVGSDKTIKVNVRVIAASNRNPKDLLESGSLRADLYYRLAVIPLEVPPLRERTGDIPHLIEHYRQVLENRGYASDFRISQKAMGALLDYPWPGNVRELENAIEHGVICAEDGVIQVDSLPSDIQRHYAHATGQNAGANATLPADVESDVVDISSEKDRILEALDEAGGNRALAASLLEIDRTTLWRRMVKYGITN